MPSYAYETACAYAVSPQEEEEQCSQIDAWIKHAEEIYDSLCRKELMLRSGKVFSIGEICSGFRNRGRGKRQIL